MEYLMLYDWPGNVRQLANEVRRLVALAEPGAVLMPEHLSTDIAASRRTIPASERDLAPTEFVVRTDQPLGRRDRARRADADSERLQDTPAAWKKPRSCSACRARACI